MKKLSLGLSFTLLLNIVLFSQVQIDRAIDLNSGTPGNARIMGIKQVSAPQDAVSAEALQKGGLIHGTVSGGTNTYTLTFSPAISTPYAQGMVITFKASGDNTGAVTINSIPLKKDVSSALAAGDIKDGQIVSAAFDGTNFQLSSRITDANSGGTVTSVSTAAANNGVTATWSMASPTPALTIGLGAITPTSVAATGTVTGSNLSGTHTGNSSGTNTGDQTLSGLGGTPATRNVTINGTTQDLSADRTWSVGTVTGVSTAVANNGVTANWSMASPTPALTIGLGAITPSSVAATGTVTGSNLSGTNTGDQTLSGLGGVSTTRKITINGTQQDLSADRSWSVGTVTSVSTAAANNGVTATWSAASPTPALTIGLGAITPASVAATGTVTGTNISGINTGDQTIILTGDVTGSGTGSFATTVGKINGSALGVTTPTDKNILIANGSSWVSRALSGDATISNTGVVTVTGGGTGNGYIKNQASVQAGSDFNVSNTGTVGTNLTVGTSTTSPLVQGSTVASGTLTLSSTASPTKGSILMGTSAYDEVNNRLGVGVAVPTTKLDVNGGAWLRNITSVGRGAATYNTLGYEVRVSGTGTTPPLVVDQDGTVRVIVDQSGNLGIGANSPVYKLDVNGKTLMRSGGVSTSLTGTQLLFGYGGGDNYMHAIKTRHHSGQAADNAIDFYIWKYGTDAQTAEPTKRVMTIDGAGTNGAVQVYGLAGTGNRAVYADASGVLTTSGTAGVISGSGTLNYISKWTPDGATLGNSMIFDNGTNVGIGNGAPVGVAGTTTLQIGRDNTTPATASDGQLVLSKTNGSSSYRSFRMGLNSSYGFSLGDYGYNGANTYTEFLTMRYDNGNVGIGAASAAEKLEVSGNIRLTNLGYVSGSNQTRTIYVNDGASNGAWGNNLTLQAGSGFVGGATASGGGNVVIQAGNKYDTGNFTSAGNVQLIAGNVGGGGTLNGATTEGAITLTSAGSERMRVHSNGNVGIGNIAPLGPLSVGNSAVVNSDGFIVVGKRDGVGGNRHMRMGFNSTFDFVIGDYGNNNVAGTWTNAFFINYAAPANSLTVNSSGNVGVGVASAGSKLAVAGQTATDQLKVNNLPAFCADLNTTQSSTATATFVEVTGWRTSGATTLFNDNNNFNTTTGRFTAPRNGYYFFSAQIRIDGVSSAGGSYARVVIHKNAGPPNIDGGLHAIANGSCTNDLYQTLSVSGVIKLAANDYVSVWALSQGDASWNIQSESGFSGYLISDY